MSRSSAKRRCLSCMPCGIARHWEYSKLNLWAGGDSTAARFAKWKQLSPYKNAWIAWVNTISRNSANKYKRVKPFPLAASQFPIQWKFSVSSSSPTMAQGEQVRKSLFLWQGQTDEGANKNKAARGEKKKKKVILWSIHHTQAFIHCWGTMPALKLTLIHDSKSG